MAKKIVVVLLDDDKAVGGVKLNITDALRNPQKMALALSNLLTAIKRQIAEHWPEESR